MKNSIRSRNVRAICDGCASIVGGIAGYFLVLPNVSYGGAFAGAIVAIVAVEMAFRYPQSIQFSIRDLLLFTVIVAILLAWWLDHRYLADDAQVTREKKAKIRDFESKVKSGFYDGRNSAPGAPVGGVSGSLNP